MGSDDPQSVLPLDPPPIAPYDTDGVLAPEVEVIEAAVEALPPPERARLDAEAAEAAARVMKNLGRGAHRPA